MTSKDITPKPALITALGNQDFQGHVPGAISELVDNSLGLGRGNATQVHITYDNRKLTILDDGVGMTDVLDLFQYGEGAGLLEGDIGKYGFGGTSALPYLSDFSKPVTIYSLREGKVTTTTVNFGKLSKAKEWKASKVTRPVSANNCPPELRAFGHGTLIELTCKRRFARDTIVEALTATYAPALRSGKHITVKYNTTARRDLKAPKWRDGLPFELTIQHQGRDYTAEGIIVSDANMPLSKSNVSVAFAHRVLFTTTDCYSHGERSYNGQGVAVALSLTGEWQDVLTSTKSDIANDSVREKLMYALFEVLEPTLIVAEEKSKRLTLGELSASLGAMLLGSAWVNGKPRRAAGTTESKNPKKGDPKPPTTPTPASPTPVEDDPDSGKVRGGASIDVVELESALMDDLLWDFRITPERPTCAEDVSITVVLNNEVPAVKRILKVESNRHESMATFVVPALVQSLVSQLSDEILENVFNKKVYTKAREIDDPNKRAAYISRQLLAGVK